VPPGQTERELRELQGLLAKIDMELYEQCKADVRAWLDARIAAAGYVGIYDFWGPRINPRADRVAIDLNRGAFADTAAQFLRAYEMLGEKRYLDAGLKTADFYLKVQQPGGGFPTGATVHRDGTVKAGGGKHAVHVARMEDGYQFRPFCLLLYAHQLTGNRKYLDGAIRNGEMVSLRMIHPEWGWCPDHFDTKSTRPYSERKTGHDTKGVSGGGSYSDYATTDGFRTAVFMYHLTKDAKYLERAANVGRWIFATQLGKGKVRGWGDNYGADNKPVPARNFEGWSIDPRNWNRFVGPLLTWLYAATGDEKYRRLFEESTEWMLSMEHPEGYAAEYTYEGHEAWTQDYKTYRYDLPAKYPRRIQHTWVKDGKPWYGWDKVQMDDSVIVFAMLKEGGREALRKRFRGAIKYDQKQYLAARIEAARRCTDEGFTVQLQPLSPGDGLWKARGHFVMGRYLERVRMRLARPDAELPAKDMAGRSGLCRQSWKSQLAGYNIVPYGWAQWQYVWDVTLALGRIDPDAAAKGGLGLESERLARSWDMMWHWESRCIDVADWLDVPLAEAIRKGRERNARRAKDAAERAARRSKQKLGGVIARVVRKGGAFAGQPEVARRGLRPGARVYMDRDYVFTDALPDLIYGPDYVRTFNSDNTSANVSYEVTISADATLYVMASPRTVGDMPWLKDGSSGIKFADTGTEFAAGGPKESWHYRLFAAEVKAGTYTLGSLATKPYYSIAATAGATGAGRK
jgi:hypothetical protein